MTIRNFRWEDVPAIAALENRLLERDGGAGTVTEQFIKEFLGQPNLTPEEELFLYEVDGELLASALVVPPEPVIRRSVLDMKTVSDRGTADIERALVRRALRKAWDLGALMLHAQVPEDSPRCRLLEEEGFRDVRVYWMMRWNPADLPLAETPAGFSFRSYGRPGDAEALTSVQNSSFGGSWGFAPNTPEEIAYRAGMSLNDHDGIIFLNHGDEVAGYCWTFLTGSGEDKHGTISMIGTHPDYRGQGLGRPLLHAGLRLLVGQGARWVELEVDDANPPATRLYTSTGFKKVSERHWFEALPGGLSPPGG